MTTNQMARKLAAERCDEAGATLGKVSSARIADHPSGTKKIQGHVPPITIGMKNHGPHPCSLDVT